jgi:hypothetical protein
VGTKFRGDKVPCFNICRFERQLLGTKFLGTKPLGTKSLGIKSLSESAAAILKDNPEKLCFQGDKMRKADFGIRRNDKKLHLQLVHNLNLPLEEFFSKNRENTWI